MQEKLKKIKVLFGDVDNTLLCLKMYNEAGKRIVGFEDANDWLKYNINNNAYIKCQAPRGMEIITVSTIDVTVSSIVAGSFETNVSNTSLPET